jgi:hypothetical protein
VQHKTGTLQLGMPPDPAQNTSEAEGTGPLSKILELLREERELVRVGELENFKCVQG